MADFPRSLQAFQQRFPNAEACAAYPGAPGVIHQPYTIGPVAAHIVLPWIHRDFANLNAWSVGVYHGLRRRHLQASLDEFVFRFNRRYSRHAARPLARTLLHGRLLRRCRGRLSLRR